MNLALLLAIAGLVLVILGLVHVGHVFLVIGLILYGVTLVVLSLGDRLVGIWRR